MEIHLACRAGVSIDAIRDLVEYDTAMLQRRGKNGAVPLHMACYARNPIDVIHYLSDKDPSTVRVRDSNGDLPVHITCRARAIMEVVRNLVEHYPMLCTLNAPVHIASHFGAPAVVMQYLVEHNPDSVRVRDGKGDLPIRAACRSGTFVPFGTIQFLVEQDPVTCTFKTVRVHCRFTVPVVQVSLYKASRCSQNEAVWALFAVGSTAGCR